MGREGGREGGEQAVSHNSYIVLCISITGKQVLMLFVFLLKQNRLC